MRIVVDNSAGGDADFAAELAALLGARGLDVEVRAPNPRAKYDTGVHQLSLGIAIRVSEPPDRSLLAAIGHDARAALLHRASERRRTRSVPVHVGETPRVIEWIDVFE